MEPISLSLIAISATSVALRRASANDANIVEFPSHRLDPEPRSSILATLGKCRLVPRKLVEPGRGTLALSLARFVAVHGLQLSIQTSLAALFDAQGEGKKAVNTSLRQRRAEFVICDAEGTPLCGIETAGRPTDGRRDPVRRKAFAQAGLPLVVLHANADWEKNRARLMEALGMEQDPANDPVSNEALPVARKIS